jgi:hypothetical protein
MLASGDVRPNAQQGSNKRDEMQMWCGARQEEVEGVEIETFIKDSLQTNL